MILVVDASMALAWIFARAKAVEAECADRVLLAMTSMAVVVPPLWHIEIANALLVGERRKLITEAQTIDFLSRLAHLPIDIDDATPLARQDQVMALAREHSLTSYDATYLDLALRKGASLATFDTALTTAVRRAGGKSFCA